MSGDVEGDRAVLGYFHPFFLFAHVKKALAEYGTTPKELEGKLSEDELFRYAMERYTLLHEMRHFHDYFGTTAGISLFYAHIGHLRAFARFIEALRSSGVELEIPFSRYLDRSDEIGKIAQGLLRNWRIFLEATAMFAAPLIKKIESTNHPGEHVVYKEMKARYWSNVMRIPTFPLTLGAKRGDDLELMSIYYPIGLEVLVEGNAQALQRGMMEAECPDIIIERLLERQGMPAQNLDDLAERALPYNISDFLVSKYLRLRGYPQFQRQSIIQLTDITLSLAFIEPVSKPWETPATYRQAAIGNLFIHHLETSPIEDVVSGNIKYPSGIDDVYREHLKAIEAWKRPDDLPNATDLISTVDKIEAAVNHHIIKPLVTKRLETNHAVFYSFEKYLECVSELPGIPALIVAGRIHHPQYMTDLGIGDAWVKYCLLSQAMHEALGLHETISCFRAQTLPKCSLNLCHEGDCDSHIEAGKCEKGSREPSLPSCLFASMIRRFSLS